MKKTISLFVCIILLFISKTQSQEYQPVIKDGSFWDIRDFTQGEGSFGC